jgi:hypothetical protein
MTAKQGHTYEWNGLKVMAMESGPFPEIRVMDDSRPWPLTLVGRVDAASLRPLPMVYFGEVNTTAEQPARAEEPR